MYIKLNGLKMRFEIGVSVEYFFQNVRHKVFIEFAQCIVTVNVLTLTDDNEERYIFSFMSVNVPRMTLSGFFVCVFVWGFSSHLRIFHTYGDVTIADEALQILT